MGGVPIYAEGELVEEVYNEPPAPQQSTAIQALSARLETHAPEGELIDPTAAPVPETRKEAKGALIPFWMTLGMTEDDGREWSTYLQGKGIDQSTAEDVAALEGIRTKEALYTLIETDERFSR